MMILAWILVIIIISVITKWVVHLLTQRQSIYLTKLVITTSCIIQFIIVFFFDESNRTLSGTSIRCILSIVTNYEVSL